MRKPALLCLHFTLIAALLSAQEGSAVLPVKRVVLYKNGVGYFEHVGQVRGNQDVSVPFTSGQLNDVLKSLTVLDLNGGKIAGVTYGTSAPVDRQLGELRLPAGEKASLTDFLAGLRGAKVEVRNGETAPLTGRLLSVERKTRIAGNASEEISSVALVTDAGEIRTAEISPAFSVKLLETGLTGKVDRLLDLAAGTREPDVRTMTVSATGSGQRSLFLSYISEVPVWKATYRIVLDSKVRKQPLLQGWAIVDNTVGQDWENVELSLVAGAPQSFVQNISQPFYTRRPVVAISSAAMMTPQTFEATLRTGGGGQIVGAVRDATGAVVPGVTVTAVDSMGVEVAQATTGSDGRYVLAGLAGGPVRVRAAARGFRTAETNVNASASGVTGADLRLDVGAVAETVDVRAFAAPMPPPPRAEMRGGGGVGSGSGGGVYALRKPLAAMYQAAAVDAAAQELGDLFEYRLNQPITIRKNRSAMVPIVQSAVDAEKVSVYNEASNAQRPVRALWITNSSGATLDGGSFSVLEDDTFAGEGVFEVIRPKEKRLASYATDLAVNASTKLGSHSNPVTRVTVSKGVLMQQRAVREQKTYTFRNEDAAARTIVVEHPARPEYELQGTEKPVESTANLYRFRKVVGPKQTDSLVVAEVRQDFQSYMLTNVDSDLIASFVAERTVNARVERELRKIVEQKGTVGRLQREKQALEKQVTGITQDQSRLRENLRSLRSTPEELVLVRRYTAQLGAQETRLDSLKVEVEEAGKKVAGAQEVLDRMVLELTLDERI